MSNYYLIFLAVLTGYLLYNKFSYVMNKNVKNVSSEEANKLLKENKELLILDVRTPSEFKSGHISGAKSLPVGEFASGLDIFEKYKEKPVIVHCASGGRSPAAVRILLKHGFKKIYHMNHGLIGWKFGLK